MTEVNDGRQDEGTVRELSTDELECVAGGSGYVIGQGRSSETSTGS